jgi:hypothetical protein
MVSRRRNERRHAAERGGLHAQLLQHLQVDDIGDMLFALVVVIVFAVAACSLLGVLPSSFMPPAVARRILWVCVADGLFVGCILAYEHWFPAAWHPRVFDRAVTAVEVALAFLYAQGFVDFQRCWGTSCFLCVLAFNSTRENRKGLRQADFRRRMQWLLWAVDIVLLSLCNIVVLCLVAPILSFRFFQTLSDWVLATTLLFTPFWFAAGDPLDYADAKWTPERLQTAARYKRAASRFLACGMAIVAVVKLGRGFNFANVAMAMVWALFACGCYFADVDERERLRLVQGNMISNLGVCYGVALLCRLVLDSSCACLLSAVATADGRSCVRFCVPSSDTSEPARTKTNLPAAPAGVGPDTRVTTAARRAQRSKRARFCGEDCQKLAWRSGVHGKIECQRMPAAGAAA